MDLLPKLLIRRHLRNHRDHHVQQPVPDLHPPHRHCEKSELLDYDKKSLVRKLSRVNRQCDLNGTYPGRIQYMDSSSARFNIDSEGTS